MPFLLDIMTRELVEVTELPSPSSQWLNVTFDIEPVWGIINKLGQMAIDLQNCKGMKIKKRKSKLCYFLKNLKHSHFSESLTRAKVDRFESSENSSIV